MDRYRLIITPEASQDIEAIYSYLIYFRVTDDNIVYILTVRHGARRKPRF